MSEEDIAMIEWLKSASPDDVLKAMRGVDKEIFRDDASETK